MRVVPLTPAEVRALERGEVVRCACGCGERRPGSDSRGRERRYLPGHAKAPTAPRWLLADDDRLWRLYEQGVSAREMARQLGRTPKAVAKRLSDVVAAPFRMLYLTTTEVGAAFGVTSHTVRHWIERGWLRGRRNGRKPALGGEYWVDPEDLTAFVRDERYWCRWWPDDMPPGAWRRLALEARAGARFATVYEAGRLLGYDPSYLTKLCRLGRIPGIRGAVRRPDGWKGNRAWYVRLDLLPAGRAS